MEETIPEDVLASAREYADEYAGDEWHYANRVGCFARAILRERERCAKVADRCLADIEANPHDFGQLDTGGRRACEKIATLIRSGV